jgi:hypothetical protein
VHTSWKEVKAVENAPGTGGVVVRLMDGKRSVRASDLTGRKPTTFQGRTTQPLLRLVGDYQSGKPRGPRNPM